mmetsp:Transcript_114049/g.303176  ORF Transcript_114049/g.303176 Transcript_114049/m.303176 type:complete len:313 (+) Transcript_114049:273-1211(+)
MESPCESWSSERRAAPARASRASGGSSHGAGPSSLLCQNIRPLLPRWEIHPSGHSSGQGRLCVRGAAAAGASSASQGGGPSARECQYFRPLGPLALTQPSGETSGSCSGTSTSETDHALAAALLTATLASTGCSVPTWASNCLSSQLRSKALLIHLSTSSAFSSIFLGMPLVDASTALRMASGSASMLKRSATCATASPRAPSAPPIPPFMWLSATSMTGLAQELLPPWSERLSFTQAGSTSWRKLAVASPTSSARSSTCNGPSVMSLRARRRSFSPARRTSSNFTTKVSVSLNRHGHSFAPAPALLEVADS